MTASAQQPSPEAAAAEAALRARVEQFYKLQVDKKFRQADAFVAEDTKDIYFGAKKPELVAVSIMKVEMLEGNTKARVTIKSKSMMTMIGVGRMPIEIPAVTLWKIENGQWMWYLDPQAPFQTPFGGVQPPGEIKPGATPDFSAMMKSMPATPAALLDQVQLDQNSLVLTAEQPVATASITNNMPGFVEVTIEQPKNSGVAVEIDHARIESGAEGDSSGA